MIVKMVCRICGGISGKFIGIFDIKGVEEGLAEKINSLLPVRVSIEDKISLQCCVGCVSSILSWDDLILKCVQVEAMLKSQYFESSIYYRENSVEEDNFNQKSSADSAKVLEDMSVNNEPFIESGSDVEEIVLNIESDEEDESNPEVKIEIEYSELNENFQFEDPLGAEIPRFNESLSAENPNSAETNENQIIELYSTVGSSYHCGFCPYKTHLVGCIRRHVNAKHTKTDFAQCDVCGFTASDKYLLGYHIKMKHTKKGLFKCQYCNYEHAKRSVIRTHERAIHTKEKMYACSICDYETGHKHMLTKHIGLKHENTGHKCERCDYTCYSRSDLRKHFQRKHIKKKTFPCPLCEFSSHNRYLWTRHLKVQHSEYRMKKKNSSPDSDDDDEKQVLTVVARG